MSSSDYAVAGDEEAQSLPLALSALLPERPRAVFHSAAATRLMIVGEAHGDGNNDCSTRSLLDFQFDVVHVGQITHLLYAWQQIFTVVQSAAPNMNPRLNPAANADEWALFLLAQSRAYRAELETCLLEAAAQLQGPNGSDASLRAELSALNIAEDDYKYQLLLLETCKSLLHLVEIVYLDPYLNLTAQLVDWTQRTLQVPRVILSEEEAEEEAAMATTGGGMLDRDSYWVCVYRMLLQGRLFEALQMIESCEELVGRGSEYHQLMQSIIEAIETVPAIAYRQQQQQQQQQQQSSSSSKSRNSSAFPSSQVPLDEFLHSFHAWQKHVRSLRDSDILAEHPHQHLDLLLLVLLGDEATMISCAQSNYLELFLGNLLYVKPHVQNSKNEMSNILQKCMQQCEQQWRETKQAAGEMSEEDEEESLYTPIDTLRFHLMSSDISSALSIMDTVIDLRFFMAHVVHLLAMQGEILHHQAKREELQDGDDEDGVGGKRMSVPKPLRLQHSSINDSITLLEFHLIAYGESLEAASSSSAGGSGGAAGNNDLMWTMAVEYFAACPENGRGYLCNLLRKQSLTLNLSSSGSDGSIVVSRRVDHRKVHRLLALCSRFGFTAEYNHVLTMAGTLCVQRGVDGLRAAGATSVSMQSSSATSLTFEDASVFGQATHWFSMLQSDAGARNNLNGGGGSGSVSHASVAQMERVGEILLDYLLLRPTAPPTQHRLAFQSIVGVLAHIPSSLIVSLDVLASPSTSVADSAAALSASNISPILTFLSAFYSTRSIWFKMQQTARDIEQEKINRLNGNASNDKQQQAKDSDNMDDSEEKYDEPAFVAAPSAASSSRLLSLLSLHSSLHSQCLNLLICLVRNCTSLLPGASRKYWMVLVQLLVQLMEERSSSSTSIQLTPTQKRQKKLRRQWAAVAQPQENSYFEFMRSTSIGVTPAAAVTPLPLDTLAHVQRLLTSLLHSNNAQQYSEPVGGAAGVKQMQLALNNFTNQTIQRHA